MAKNWLYYVANDDFEGAFERFQQATKNWKNYWFNVCAQIADNCAEWLKQYTIDREHLTIEEKIPVKRTRREYQIDTNGVDLLDNTAEKCYLFRFFDADGKRICSKIGTTTRKVKTRMREELASKTYIQMGAVSAVIDRVYCCDPFPAEGLESRFRAEYIRKFPDSFKKNDRFILRDFDLNEADKIVQDYFAECG